MSTSDGLSIGKRIRKEREARSWSQKMLAEEMIDASEKKDLPDIVQLILNISRWERGKSAVSPFYRAILCKAFGMTPNELFGLPQDEEENEVIISQGEQTSPTGQIIPTIPYEDSERVLTNPKTTDRLPVIDSDRDIQKTISIPVSLPAEPMKDKSSLLETEPPTPKPALPPHRSLSTSILATAGILVAFLVIIVGVLYADVVLTNIRQQGSTSHSVANATATTGTQATVSVIAANTYPSYLPGYGTLALYDPLTDTSNSPGVQLFDSHSRVKVGRGVFNTMVSESCSFKKRSYHIFASGILIPNCLLSSSVSFSNFAFEVQMKIIDGDCGGVTFRSDISNEHDYYFQVCQNGHFDLNIDDLPIKNLNNLFNPAIHQGPNQTNLLDVVANKDTIMLYVNRQLIAHTTDRTYSQGQLGLTAADTISSKTEVAYNNAIAWKL